MYLDGFNINNTMYMWKIMKKIHNFAYLFKWFMSKHFRYVNIHPLIMKMSKASQTRIKQMPNFIL